MDNQQNEYTLTQDEQGLVMPLIETIENLQKEAQTLLRAITRHRKLDGNWNLVGNKFVRMAAAGGKDLEALYANGEKA